jgi:hypothetical protein
VSLLDNSCYSRQLADFAETDVFAGATKWFALPPGSYTFVASYLGAESAPQTVEVRPVLKDGVWTTRDHVVTLTVAPID